MGRIPVLKPREVEPGTWVTQKKVGNGLETVKQAGKVIGENVLAHVRRVCDDISMTTRFTYWIEADGKYLGYLNEYPDHWTQGDSIQDLKEHLRDLHGMFSAEEIPGIKKEAELELA